TVTNSGLGATLTLSGPTTFEGDLTGALALDVANGLCDLSGLSKFTGDTTVEASQQLINDGIFDLTTNSDVAAGGAGTTFTNNGLFEKTGGAGTSTVATAFANNGNVVVTSGSVQFTGGFTNVGVVQGLLTGTTVTANAAGQTTFFGGTGDNLIK